MLVDMLVYPVDLDCMSAQAVEIGRAKGTPSTRLELLPLLLWVNPASSVSKCTVCTQCGICMISAGKQFQLCPQVLTTAIV